MAPLEDQRPEHLAGIDEAEGAADEVEGALDEAEGAVGEAEGAVGEAEGAAWGGCDASAGAPGRRVRFALGISELPGNRAVVVLHEDAFLRWRPTPRRPDGALSRLDGVAIGAAIAVEHGGIWDEGIVVDRVVRPARAGGFQVDGDVERYPSIAEAEQAHGPLEVGEPREEPSWPGAPAIELGEPIGRDPRGIGRRARR
ncbi:hypothetical protein SOCEGT47_082990 [Sorangium cellulosum]|uniref:Uncharacterized protein n=1 Tax=Sorangium cellulosum TaxID=56 RepID=A0A4P2QE41_SORCE|nr:hypothetical protein [Sorangium cellulosum]AUX27701.1 hypothetical protein SOCEGT47_082990 [Sorangium cellulosum]